MNQRQGHGQAPAQRRKSGSRFESLDRYVRSCSRDWGEALGDTGNNEGHDFCERISSAARTTKALSATKNRAAKAHGPAAPTSHSGTILAARATACVKVKKDGGSDLGLWPCGPDGDEGRLLAVVESGKLRLDDVISYRFPRDDAARAYDIFNKKQEDCVKVVLKPSFGER